MADWWATPQFKNFAGNALADLSYGLTTGTNLGNALGEATKRTAQMQPQRDEEAERQRALQETNDARAQAIENMRTKYNAADIADMVEQGGMDVQAGWNEVMRRMQPQEAAKPTASIQEYQLAQSQGYAGTFADYEKELRAAGATNIDFNQNQGVAAGFADRMQAANQVLDDPNLLAAMTDITKPALAGVPGVGNFMVGPEYQQAEQAQRDFVNAILRRESGAAIAPSEFENAKKQYFPQPGDSPEVIKQKAQNRQIAIQGVVRAAGPSYAAPSLSPGGVIDPYAKYGLEPAP